MYSTQEDYILFFLAIALFLFGLALLGAIIKWRERQAAKRRKQQLRNLNRREDWRRQHNAYIAHMEEVLGSVGRGRST